VPRQAFGDTEFTEGLGFAPLAADAAVYLYGPGDAGRGRGELRGQFLQVPQIG
jgi:hypothetical protein